jgi:AraC-like DNA-binding protein
MNKSKFTVRNPERDLQSQRAKLAQRVASLTGSAEAVHTAIPGVYLARRTAPSTPCAGAYRPSIIVVVQGAKRVNLGQSSFLYDESRYLLTALDLPIVSQVVKATVAKPMLAVAVSLDMTFVRELLSRDEIQAHGADSDHPAMITGTVTPQLLSACNRLLELLSTPKEIAYMSDLIHREIVYRILSGPEGARLRAIATLGNQSHRTAKAIAWIRDNYTKQLRVEDLAHIAGMGVSTFHHHFRILTNMSPLQYQKNLRLQAARGRMLVEGLDATTVAYGVGYESVNQFNREYSRFFGLPPMRDVRTALAAGSSAFSL